MDELKKKKVLAGFQGASRYLLVIDGSSGQNAISQVAEFDRALGLTGLVTKLDGGARGGVIFSIESELELVADFLRRGWGRKRIYWILTLNTSKLFCLGDF